MTKIHWTDDERQLVANSIPSWWEEKPMGAITIAQECLDEDRRRPFRTPTAARTIITSLIASRIKPPARVEPARVEPARVEPARVEPARVEPGLEQRLETLVARLEQNSKPTLGNTIDQVLQVLVSSGGWMNLAKYVTTELRRQTEMIKATRATESSQAEPVPSQIEQAPPNTIKMKPKVIAKFEPQWARIK